MSTHHSPTTGTVTPPPTQQQAQQQGQFRQNQGQGQQNRQNWEQYLPPKTRVMAALALLTFVLGIIVLWPSFQGAESGKESAGLAKESLKLDQWQVNMTFRVSCQGEKDAGRELTEPCEDVLNRPLPALPYIKRNSLAAFIEKVKRRWYNSPRSNDRTSIYMAIAVFVIVVLAAGMLWKYWPEGDDARQETLLPHYNTPSDNTLSDNILSDNTLSDNILSDNILSDNVSGHVFSNDIPDSTPPDNASGNVFNVVSSRNVGVVTGNIYGNTNNYVGLTRNTNYVGLDIRSMRD